MLVILHPNTQESSKEYKNTWDHLSGLKEIILKKHKVQGKGQNLTEIYLIGNTSKINQEEIESLPAVERVVRISHDFRILGRHSKETDSIDFEYNGIRFNQECLHIFAGLCAVDNHKNVKIMMQSLQKEGQKCTRMGAYKPRTNPYSFQGHGKSCLNYVFDLAGEHDIKVIAMEVTHESHIEEINDSLEKLRQPTGVILQIGTRNTQNFELLKAVGRQHKYPVLLKRGFGISLNESLNAAEYLASEGNNQVIFCLRGMKTSFNSPHRNMVDFAHLPIVKRLTKMPVCIDPSHSVGTREMSPDGILDVLHSTSQGIVAGANMVLVDFHPSPKEALVDGPQALHLNELGKFIDDVKISREAYKKRVSLWSK